MKTSAKSTLSRVAIVATLVAASVALSGCSLINGVLNGGSKSGVVQGDGANTDVFTIKVGDCLNDAAADGTVSSVPTVKCSQPHDTEAFKSIVVAEGAFPGETAIKSQASEQCKTAFGEFAGISYDSSKSLDYSYYYPTTDSWANGDREILCLILSIDSSGNPVKTTGTLKGANR
jgi:hypothetical protein